MIQSNGEDMKAVLNRLLAAGLQFPVTSGVHQTAIPFLTVLKEMKATPISHGVLKPSFCIVLQGVKKLQAGDKALEYGAGDYMAASVDMPVNGQVLQASADLPYIAFRIELTPEEVSTVALDADLHFQLQEGTRQSGVFVGKPGLEVFEAFERLLRLTADSRAANYLASAVKREIIYRLLDGEEGTYFYRNMMLHHEASGISKVINWITSHYDSPFSIGELAELGNMSVSNLHYKFKEVTAMAPLQYQKRLRLQEARRLLLAGERNVTETALRVGYNSSTQFTREYKRLFGYSPLKDIHAVHEGERFYEY
ncbi:AraC family transcriptional regulator [Paenibacillus gorillae]|uniref:AraC family transcriptional regulator n=1 Tax=Paenibacillus gorillae TaxID=1243662 RepID=UPI0004AC6B75|nr:AraC family transcriptional regulator [Paenibacillus gorillae]